MGLKSSSLSVLTPEVDDRDYLVQIGAIVSPLKKGIHSLTIRGVFDGDAILELVGEGSNSRAITRLSLNHSIRDRLALKPGSVRREFVEKKLETTG